MSRGFYNLKGGIAGLQAYATNQAQKKNAAEAAKKQASDLEAQGRTGKMDADLADREQLLKQQFAQAKSRIGGQRAETERQAKMGMDRLAAQTGQTGGAIAKAQQRALRDIGRGFGEVEGELGGQEAAAVAGLREADVERRQQADQFEKSLGLQKEGLELQREQFDKNLEFQKDSFAEQLKFMWAEFDENLKTNFINSAIALRDAKLSTPKAWKDLLDPKTGILTYLSNPEFVASQPVLKTTSGGYQRGGDYQLMPRITYDAQQAMAARSRR